MWAPGGSDGKKEGEKNRGKDGRKQSSKGTIGITQRIDSDSVYPREAQNWVKRWV